MIDPQIFWNNKYKSGLGSGKGSIGKYRIWKWKIIYRHVRMLKSVIDVGCGDLSFWENVSMFDRVISKLRPRLRKCESYIGIDLSDEIIEINRKKFPDRFFVCANSSDRLELDPAHVVLCMDLLFHILDEKIFLRTLGNLCHYSKEWIFIYNWKNNPFSPDVTDNKQQYYRNLDEWIGLFNSLRFFLVDVIPVPLDHYGAMYILRRN